ncbi:MAG: methylated-DNA--[protein]-cysteine S-methyltransferase [Acidobacteriota bacterium]
MRCARFQEVQLETLLGETSLRERRAVASHARRCESCRESAARDRLLEAAFAMDKGRGGQGFPAAHRNLLRSLEDRRAFCCRVDGPFGPVYVARTVRGLCRIAFCRTEREFLQKLEKSELLPEFDPARVAREVGQLRDYFSGRCKRFRLPLDLGRLSPFQRRVLRAAAAIPFGGLASYSDIARRIGQPEARRAVGGALGKNPVAIVIPCHRVVAADGSIGGYTGGLHIKRELLRIEGVSLQGGGR